MEFLLEKNSKNWYSRRCCFIFLLLVCLWKGRNGLFFLEGICKRFPSKSYPGISVVCLYPSRILSGCSFFGEIVFFSGKKERAALTGITILYFFVQNLYQIFELEMAFTSYPFYSWIFYCILGYLLDSMELTGKQKNRLILSGIPAFLVSAWEVCFWERENPALHNYSLTMIVMTTAVYLTVTTYGKPLAQSFAKGINWIAGRSFFFI